MFDCIVFTSSFVLFSIVSGFIFFCKSLCNIVKNCFILLLNSWGLLSGGAGPLWAWGSGRGAVTHLAWLVFFASPVFFDLFYCEDKSGIIETRTSPVLQVSCRWCSAGCRFESLVWHQRRLVTRLRSCYISPVLNKGGKTCGVMREGSLCLVLFGCRGCRSSLSWWNRDWAAICSSVLFKGNLLV